MFKVSVFKNNQEVQTVLFETQLKAQEWIDFLAQSEAWGKPERWVADVLSAKLSAAEKTSALQTREIGSVTEYLLPAQYTTTITDITAEVEAEKAIQRYLARIQFGQRVMAELAAKNKAALDAQTMSQAQVLALKQALGPVKDFLTEGSLGFALTAIQSLNDSSIPVELKQYFVTLIQDYLTKET